MILGRFGRGGVAHQNGKHERAVVDAYPVSRLRNIGTPLAEADLDYYLREVIPGLI
jgi:hypothetical protein